MSPSKFLSLHLCYTEIFIDILNNMCMADTIKEALKTQLKKTRGIDSETPNEIRNMTNADFIAFVCVSKVSKNTPLKELESIAKMAGELTDSKVEVNLTPIEKALLGSEQK